jgi:hypothetical protein
MVAKGLAGALDEDVSPLPPRSRAQSRLIVMLDIGWASATALTGQIGSFWRAVAARSCRIASVACAHAYALTSIFNP